MVHHHRASRPRSVRLKRHHDATLALTGPALELGDQRLEGLAALLEIAELVERRAGRRQQNHRTAAAIRPRGACRLAQGGRQIAALGAGDALRERPGEGAGRLADQIGVAHAIQPGQDRIEPGVLGPPAGDPVDVLEARQRPRRGVGVGRLAVVDELHAIERGDRLQAVSQALKVRQAGGDRLRREPERAHRAVGRRGILPVVGAAQARDRPQIEHRGGGPLDRIVQLAIEDIDAAIERAADRDRHQAPIRPGGELPVEIAAVVVVDAEHGPVARALIAQDPALGANVAGQAAVSLEMVWAQVQDHRHGTAQMLGQLELVRRQLQHIDVFYRFRQ